jgi:cell division transport system ATP-binding protein
MPKETETSYSEPEASLSVSPEKSQGTDSLTEKKATVVSKLSALKKPLLGLTKPKNKDQAVDATSPSRPVLIEFRDVTKYYDRHLAVDDISVKLYKGEFLSLVGPSGAGKSSFIKCLTLQEWPDKGRIIVAGRDITMLRPRELPYYRRKVGVVFQDFKLLPNKTVFENVAFALEVSNVTTKEIRQRVGVMLDTVGMGHKRDNFPNELSGGEQQRVAIARALVHDPKILIADEPTGNLDPVNTWEIIELLFKINKSGTMVILATHDREIVDALKKRVITMRAGKIVSDQEKGMYLV